MVCEPNYAYMSLRILLHVTADTYVSIPRSEFHRIRIRLPLCPMRSIWFSGRVMAYVGWVNKYDKHRLLGSTFPCFLPFSHLHLDMAHNENGVSGKPKTSNSGSDGFRWNFGLHFRTLHAFLRRDTPAKPLPFLPTHIEEFWSTLIHHNLPSFIPLAYLHSSLPSFLYKAFTDCGNGTFNSRVLCTFLRTLGRFSGVRIAPLWLPIHFSPFSAQIPLFLSSD